MAVMIGSSIAEIVPNVNPASGTDDPRFASLQKDVSSAPGVAAVTPVQVDKQGTTAYFNAISKAGPSDGDTTTLVRHLRSSVIPAAEQGTNMTAHVCGSTAGYDDLASRI